MKFLKTFLYIVVFSGLALAQQKTNELDKSPMDMSYWPNNYPILKMNGKITTPPVARLIYSRPQKSNRVIFDGIVKYGIMWRLGANEATEVEFFKNVKINGKSIAKGKYTLYCIPYEDKWTMIVNKDLFCWGNFTYNQKNDVTRIEVKTQKTTEITEALTAYFDEATNGANLIFMWDDVKVSMPIGM